MEDEFLQYQLLQETATPETVWQAALVTSDKVTQTQNHRMDIICSHLLKIKDSGSGCPMFEKLAQVALLVLTLPHINAAEERIFSLISKNKTKF